MKGQEHVADTLSDYLNGDLPEARRALIQEHLAECAECRQDLASLRFTVKAIRHLPEQNAPRSFTLPENASRSRFAFLSNLFWLRTIVGVAVAMLVVVLAFRFAAPYRSAPAPTPQIASAPAAAPIGAFRAPGPVGSQAQPGGSGGSAGGANSSASTAAQPAGPARPLAVQSVLTPAAATAYPAAATAYPAPAAQPVPPSQSTAYPNLTSSPVARAAPATQSQAKGGTDNAAPEPLLQPSPGPVWYTPALGLLGLLAVIAATALYLLDRRKR